MTMPKDQASKILIAAIGVLIVAGLAHTFILPGTPTPIPSTAPTPYQNISQSRAYENQYMKLIVPSGWELTEKTVTSQNKIYDKATDRVILVGAPVTEKTGAVDITKGKYILHIDLWTSQASGIEGGRFAEIAMGVPSADAVITEHPSPPCGISELRPAFAGHSRMDLYVNNQEKSAWCATPADGSTVWYFSYVIGNNKRGYFNYYTEVSEPRSYVITMAYNSKNISELPLKDSEELNAMLSEMTDILDTLEFKQR